MQVKIQNNKNHLQSNGYNKFKTKTRNKKNIKKMKKHVSKNSMEAQQYSFILYRKRVGF